MEFAECRSEASIGLPHSTTTVLCEEEQSHSRTCEKASKDFSSPTGKRKRKLHSPPSSPNAVEGFGDSEAGDILKQFPELEEVFTIVRKVGEGTFSNVYLASMKDFPDQLCALKHIIPTSGPARIENELICLQHIGGKDNVIGIDTTYRKNDHIVFVLPYVPHQKFQDYFLGMSVCEIRQYMKNLFIALKRVHSFDVIHRDIKPSNFLYSSQSKQYTLVDFGLAMQVPGSTKSLLGSPTEKKVTTPKTSSRNPLRRSTRLSPQVENKDSVTQETSNIERNSPHNSPHNKVKSILKTSMLHSGNVQFACNPKNFKMPVSKRQIGTKNQHLKQSSKSKLLCHTKHTAEEICTACMTRSHQNAPRAGTPGFRSPEVLLKCPNQTTAVDIWSGGIIMLCLLSGRYPFFRAYDDMTALAQIISVIGSSECIKSANQIGKDLTMNAKLSQGDLKAACQRLRRGCSKTSTIGCILNESTTSNKDSTNNYTSKKSRRKSLSSKDNSQSEDSNSQVHVPNVCSICKDGQNTTEYCDSSKEPIHLDGSICKSEYHRCCWTIPCSAYDLLQRCLDLNPHTRITASQALEHPFFQ